MKRLHISLLIFMLLALPSMSIAQEDTWTRKADMPTARWVLPTSVVNGKIYAIGGSPSDLSLSTPIVEVYDPARDTWIRKADMPTARWGLATSAVSGKIYAMGGTPGGTPDRVVHLSTVEEYDPATDTSSIEPNAGGIEGGTPVIITGTGFMLEGLDVLIGGAEASFITPRSSTKIIAKTPPSTPGVKDVEVTNPDGQKATLKDGFTYNPMPTITRLTPDHGTAAGGAKLTIEGTGFLHVEVITVRIFNLRGVPIGIVRGTDSNEVRWHNPSVHVGLYVYLLEARIEGGKVRRFKNMLEVCK